MYITTTLSCSKTVNLIGLKNCIIIFYVYEDWNSSIVIFVSNQQFACARIITLKQICGALRWREFEMRRAILAVGGGEEKPLSPFCRGVRLLGAISDSIRISAKIPLRVRHLDYIPTELPRQGMC